MLRLLRLNVALHWLRRADVCPGAKFGVGPREYRGSFVGKLDVPAMRKNAKDTQRASGAEPAFCNLFEMFYAVRNVPLCILLGEVQ